MDFSMHSSCNALWDCFLSLYQYTWCGLRIWPVDILKRIFFRTVSMRSKNASHIGSSLGFRKEPVSVSCGRQMKADAGRHAEEIRAQSKQNTQITSILQCVRCRKVNIPIPYLVYVSPTPASESWQRQEQKRVNKSMHTTLLSNSPEDDYPQYI